MSHIPNPFASQRPEHRDWYRITNKAGEKTARIDLFDAIGGWFGIEAKDLVRDINDLDVDIIEFHINSPGGSVFDGITIYNALLDHSAKVYVVVDGLAASAASFIAMAGDEITVNRAARMMIHDASAICWGNSGDMEYMADLLNEFSDDIAGIYADRAGGTIKEWRDAMKKETWYDADEAIEAGLATKKAKKKDDEDDKAANRFDLSALNSSNLERLGAVAIATRSPKVSASVTNKQDREYRSMTEEELEILNLKPDATEDEIKNRLTALVKNEAETGGEPSDKPDGDTDEGDDDKEDEEGEADSPNVDEALAAPETVAVDKGVWNSVQADLRALKARDAAREAADKVRRRDDLIENALRVGKIRASERQEYEDAFDGNEKSITALINKLQPNTVPTNELGIDGELAQIDDAYDDSLLTPAEKRRIEAAKQGA